ncbi:MAG: hypothetical protein LBO63_01585 [Oscillospiraceae bacterium]|jgi:epoxyqueuosine reductase QueG|nr:hypothetical protein [Oscillospiraceae bacterium]
MSVSSRQIKDFVRSLGMDLCGIANMDRFATSPPGRHPRDVLPGCRSAVVFGVKLLDGVVQANFRAFEDGRDDLKGIYGTYGYTMLPNFELTYVCYAVARFIESKTGAVATPCSTGPMTNGAQVSIRHAAVAAGLGEFGYMSIVLTPEFGPRVRFGVVLTTLELAPDPMYSGKKLCDPKKCGVCAKVCPTCSIKPYGEGELLHVEMGGREFEYTRVHFTNCRKSLQAMTKATGGREDYLPQDDPTMQDYIEAEMKMPIDGMGLQHIPSWNCGKCQTYCPAGNWGKAFIATGLSRGPATQYKDAQPE